MKKKMNWLKKSVLVTLAVIMAVSMAVPTPAHAAAKSTMTVKVKTPKTGVKISGTKMVVHDKKTAQLSVTHKGKNITSKVKYTSSNKRVIAVNKKGKVTIKGNGAATLTVKYGKVVKRYKVTAGVHTWKPHTKTKTVERYATICNCGVNLTNLEEKKYCAECKENCGYTDKCVCKAIEHSMNHILNNEPSNYGTKTIKETVKYVDYYYCNCGAKKTGEPEPK